MAVSLIVTDIDGTLLNTNGEVTPAVKAAFAEADEAGILLAIGSGRVMDECKPVFRELPQLRLSINCTGASVNDLNTGREIYADPIPMEEVRRFYRLLSRFDCLFEVMAEGHCYSDAACIERMRTSINSYYMKVVEATRTRTDILRFLENRTAAVTKLHILFPDTEDQKQAFRLLENEPYLVLSSIPQNLEINTPSANKGVGVKKLSEYLGIPQSEIMCIGDNTNDIGMLKEAGYPVAMANSHSELLPYGKYRTASCDEDGVAVVIRHVLNGTLEQLRAEA